MKSMHAQMGRLYEAARAAGRLSGEADQTDMARLLNVAPQNVNNWEKRGPSKEALLDAQAAFGVNATWAATGTGPMFIGGSPPDQGDHWPFARIDVRRIQRLSPDERAYVEGKLEAVIEAVEARIQEQKSGKQAA
ncbi:helix-turn-helix domain-containing protein [Bordetella avium]|uniref:helix-turn-helix domain-containing protein n=1 Tax=Bordetella avium TaxID=521 RepID=UPI0011C3CEFA|nr:helix-turn-helix transcriptional regulator [Bordetella avium]